MDGSIGSDGSASDSAVDSGVDSSIGLCEVAGETHIHVSVTQVSGTAGACTTSNVFAGTIQQITADETTNGIRIRVGDGVGDPGFDSSCEFLVENVGSDIAGLMSGLGEAVHVTFEETAITVAGDATCDCAGCACGFALVFGAADAIVTHGDVTMQEFSFRRGTTTCSDSTTPHAVDVFELEARASVISSETPVAAATEGQTLSFDPFSFYQMRVVRSHVLDAPPSQSAAWAVWKLAVDG